MRELFSNPEKLDKEFGISFSFNVNWERSSIDCGFLIGVENSVVEGEVHGRLDIKQVVYSNVEVLKENYETYPGGKRDPRPKGISANWFNGDQFIIFKMNIGSGDSGAEISRLPILFAEYLKKKAEHKAKCNENPSLADCENVATEVKSDRDALDPEVVNGQITGQENHPSPETSDQPKNAQGEASTQGEGPSNAQPVGW